MGGGISNIRKLMVGVKPSDAVVSNRLEAKDSTLREVNVDAPLTLESPAPKKHHLISQLSLNIVLSPRRELALRSSVPFTPCGDKANTFCYYCPLCMEFFESILKTKCCKNYICLACTLEYLNAKGLLAQSVKEVVGNVSLKTMSCPHCLTIGFDPQLVESEESIRDYSHPQLETITGSTSPCNSCTPLKIGDTFEDLKRKMIPFAVTKALSSVNNEGIAGSINGSKKQLSLPDINKLKKPTSLNSIFDNIADEEDRVPSDTDRPRNIHTPPINNIHTPPINNIHTPPIINMIPHDLIVDCLSDKDTKILNTNISISTELKELPTEIETERRVDNNQDNVTLQVKVTILCDSPGEEKEILNNLFAENSSLKTCCRIIASEMMKTIIENIVRDK